ncbi:MAG TPA: YggT family protein [Chitinispirillaceae bacterium]|nr:YggT family protein [Chitinispirillaceae bacterium]
MRLIYSILNLYELVIFARVILSWVNADPYNSIVRFIYNITEPVLAPIRQLIPTERIGLDLSPFVVILVIQIIQRVLL